MFRKSRTDEATAKVQDATARTGRQIREKVVPAIGAKAHDAKQWATPHVERGMEAAAPRVEAAVDRVSPAVDATRDKIVEDLLPRLVDAVHAAAAAGATAGAAGQVARSRGQDAYSVLRGETEVKTRRKGKYKMFIVLTAVAAAIGAAFAAFKRQAPKDDPWAVPAGTYPTSTSGTSSTTATGGTSSTGTSTQHDTLGSGQAASALDNGSAKADVPGLSVDSAAAKDSVSGLTPTTATPTTTAATTATPTPEELHRTPKKPTPTLDKPQSADKA